MRIAFVLMDFDVGGAQRHTADLASALMANGHDCHFVGLSRVRATPALNVKFNSRLHFIERSGGGYLQLFAKLRNRLNEISPEIVISVNQSPAVAVAISSWGVRGYKTVNIFHTTLLRDTFQKWSHPAYLFALKRTDSLVFVSNLQRQYWESKGLYARKNVVITNGVDTTFFQPPAISLKKQMRVALGIEPDKYVIALSARFRAEKNHFGAVKALVRLRQCNGHLLLIGGGPLEEAVKSEVIRLNLVDHVTFTGEVSDARIPLAAADVGLNCSTSVETFSLAALESLAMGKPMVMSNIGGATEIVQDSITGYVFPPNDTEAMTDKLVKLANLELREEMSSAGIADIRSRHTYLQMLQGYEGLFLTLAGVS